MKKALFIVGPTASGKTDLAAEIAANFPFELISADSIQVYKNCDIISGKDHPQNIHIDLIDIISPFESFSVSDFVREAGRAIIRIHANDKIPLIVGGTGLYADALFSKIETINIPPNKNLRQNLEKKTVAELQKNLEEINPARFLKMNESDVKNSRRLIRAIEVSKYKKNDLPAASLFETDEILIIGLRASSENLRQRIEMRVDKRLAEGALVEAENLFENYSKLVPHIKNANGYKQLFSFLAGEISFEQAKEQWITADYRHAKKQMTWFAKNRQIHWFDIEKPGFERSILRLVEQNFTSI